MTLVPMIKDGWKEHRRLIYIILLAELIHIPIYAGGLSIDTCIQMDMAVSFLNGQGFSTQGGVSPHFGPLISLLYSPFILAMGPTPNAVHTFQMAFLPLLITAAYKVGGVYGKEVGLITALFTAFDPVLYGAMTAGLSGVVVATFLLGGFYYLLRAMKNSYYLMGAGLFSAMVYLTKATTGYLLIIAIIVGFVWRFYYDRWKVLKDKGYILGAVVFGIIFLTWTVRNFLVLGSPWMSTYTTDILQSFIAEPPLVLLKAYGTYVAIFGAYIGLLLSVPVIILHRGIGLKNAVLALRKRQDLSAIAVFILGLWILGAFAAAAIATEVETSAGLPHLRYVAVVDPLIFACFAIGIINAGAGGHGNSVYGKLHAAMRSPWTAAYLALVIILILPNYLSYNDLHRFEDLHGELEERDVRVVWSDVPRLIEYNTNDPGNVEFKQIIDIEQVPPGSTMVLTEHYYDGLEQGSVPKPEDSYGYLVVIFGSGRG